MDGGQSRTGNSDQMLLGLLAKGFSGYFQPPQDGNFSDLLAKLDDAAKAEQYGERRAKER